MINKDFDGFRVTEKNYELTSKTFVLAKVALKKTLNLKINPT